MLGWGAFMTAQGFTTNYAGLISTRVFLGVFEAGLFPGVNYYLSCWYKVRASFRDATLATSLAYVAHVLFPSQRKEFGLRAALFFSAATVSGAFVSPSLNEARASTHSH